MIFSLNINLVEAGEQTASNHNYCHRNVMNARQGMLKEFLSGRLKVKGQCPYCDRSYGRGEGLRTAHNSKVFYTRGKSKKQPTPKAKAKG